MAYAAYKAVADWLASQRTSIGPVWLVAEMESMVPAVELNSLKTGEGKSRDGRRAGPLTYALLRLHANILRTRPKSDEPKTIMDAL